MQPNAPQPQLKKLSRVDLFNILQDMRHYLIIDLRPKINFNEGYIRRSINLDVDGEKLDEDLKKLSKEIDLLESEALANEFKYKFQKIRRVIFMDEGELDENSSKYKIFFSFFQETIKMDKYYILSKGFKNFKEKYNFLCLDSKNTSTEIYLYSLSRFPSEIIENSIYLGDVYNSNNKRQLDDLSIKTLFDFIEYNADSSLPSFKKDNFNYINIPIDAKIEVVIDFDEINQQIDKALEEKKGSVLLYCKDGDKISPGIAISYLMFKKNLKLTIASLSVFQKRSCVEIEKWIYTQLLNYVPNKNQSKKN